MSTADSDQVSKIGFHSVISVAKFRTTLSEFYSYFPPPPLVVEEDHGLTTLDVASMVSVKYSFLVLLRGEVVTPQLNRFSIQSSPST